MARISLENKLHIGAWIIMLGYFLPYVIWGQDLSITIHDNLDSNLVWLKLIFENTTLTSANDTIIPQIMNGVPLSSLAPVYDLQFFIFKTFGIFNGYVFIRFLMLVIGFYGMRALLTTQYSCSEASTPVLTVASVIITYGVSLCFALLPHWGYNLSIATLPIVFNALLNIQNRKANTWDFVAIGFVGFTASLILVGLFILVGFGLFGLLEAYTKRKSPLPLYKGLILLSIAFIITHARLFAAVLNPSAGISHRTEFDLLYNWPGVIFSRASQMLTEGWYHSASIHQLILLLVPIALWLIWKKAKDYIFLNAIEFIIISCLWYSLVNWSGAAPLISIITDIVPIQLGRLHFIQPLVWYILFALSLFYIAKHTKWGKTAAPILIAAQIVILCFHHEGYTQRDMPSYKAFYATDLFDEVKAYLGPEESVKPCIFISSHPAILQYNGFHTLDGYLADYPLTYKHAFGQIIQGELDKDPKLAKSFNNWGSRAYSMTAQLGKVWIHTKPSTLGKNSLLTTNNSCSEAEVPRNAGTLSYNWQAFTNLGGKYIFSPLPINDPNLQHLKTFDHQDAAWTIYLYIIKGVSSTKN